LRHRNVLASAVRDILLNMDSQGSAVARVLDVADMLYSALGRKPLWAMLSETTETTAYLIASACKRVTVPRSGSTGGVGPICAHADVSGELEPRRVAVTLIRYGACKADGIETVPLSDPTLAALQADVDALGNMMVEAEARNRGMKPAAVRGTERDTFLEATGFVGAGFADAVLAPNAACRDLLAVMAVARDRRRRL
jgi:ClpP class serine protease